jgi:hypothetical integral membrane protein (TIGR02206 family)
VPLFGLLHLSIIFTIAAAAVLLAVLCRRVPAAGRWVRLCIGSCLLVNELVWFVFRYSHEGVHLANLPLQLCDLSLWLSVLACFFPTPALAEFAYFAGLAGAGMAVLTPDLWRPWPSYPAIYFFIAHGGIVIAVSVLVFGGLVKMRPNAVWRAYGLLLAFTAIVGAFDAISGANFMYLRRKPEEASILNELGPWPVYIIAGTVLALALFWLLWLPVRPSSRDK